ncbi:hypothetical protein TYRP_014604 [Tyrophagus putrescentiae]|nr:hypothetical protein TYRP_014604 [Tyrophagus putrescentiae]
MLPEAEEKEEKGGNLAIRMPVSYHNSSEPPVTACKVIEFAAKEGRWSCGFMDVDVAGAVSQSEVSFSPLTSDFASTE